MRDAIKSALLQHVGVALAPHQFRHLAVQLALDAKPGHHEEARRLLGHTSLVTTTRRYSGSENGATRVPSFWTAARCAPARSRASGQAMTAPGASAAPSCTGLWTRWPLLALHVTAASADDRAEVGRLAETVQETTGQSVAPAFMDRGHTDERAADAAKAHGVELDVLKPPEVRTGFVPLPRRWVEGARSPGPPACTIWSATPGVTPTPWPTHAASPSSASCWNKPPDWQQVRSSL